MPFIINNAAIILARGEGRERYFGCNLMQRKVLALSHQYFNGGSTRNSTQNSRSALGTVTNTNSKLLIYGLFQEGRVLAQDGVSSIFHSFCRHLESMSHTVSLVY